MPRSGWAGTHALPPPLAPLQILCTLLHTGLLGFKFRARQTCRYHACAGILPLGANTIYLLFYGGRVLPATAGYLSFLRSAVSTCTHAILYDFTHCMPHFLYGCYRTDLRAGFLRLFGAFCDSASAVGAHFLSHQMPAAFLHLLPAPAPHLAPACLPACRVVHACLSGSLRGHRSVHRLAAVFYLTAPYRRLRVRSCVPVHLCTCLSALPALPATCRFTTPAAFLDFLLPLGFALPLPRCCCLLPLHTRTLLPLPTCLRVYHCHLQTSTPGLRSRAYLPAWVCVHCLPPLTFCRVSAAAACLRSWTLPRFLTPRHCSR